MNLVNLLRGMVVTAIVGMGFVVPLSRAQSCSASSNTNSATVSRQSSSQRMSFPFGRAACDPIEWKPECDPDDTFSAVQCKGEEDNGRCFCYSPEGSRIFGWSWWRSKEKMTCRCSRQRLRLSKQLNRRDVSIHCMQNGNYEKLQCDSGMCWCVEPKTGRPKERFYPQSMMAHLPCYPEKPSELEEDEEEEEEDEDEDEDEKEKQKEKELRQLQATASLRYLRQCESKALARLVVLAKLEAHGRINAHIDEPLCDDDGSYSKYQLEKKNVFCVWKNSKKIGNYQALTSAIGKMDCNCARDTMIYEDENMEMPMECGGNGNYESLQMSNGRPYCVDRDGFATTELCNFGDALKCSS